MPKYRAFISYSQNDKRWAKKVQRALEHYRVPLGLLIEGLDNDRKLGRFFRDDDELASSASLSSALEDAIDGSESLIVICSRDAARSRWVNEEIIRFKSRDAPDRIFALIVDGEPNASLVGDTSKECFPPALRYQLDDQGRLTDIPDEPLAPDVRKESFARIKARLAAGLLSIGFDELWRREERRRKRTMASALVIGAFVVTGFGILAGLWLGADRASRNSQGANYLARSRTFFNFENYDRGISNLLSAAAISTGQQEETIRYAAALLSSNLLSLNDLIAKRQSPLIAYGGKLAYVDQGRIHPLTLAAPGSVIGDWRTGDILAFNQTGEFGALDTSFSNELGNGAEQLYFPEITTWFEVQPSQLLGIGYFTGSGYGTSPGAILTIDFKRRLLSVHSLIFTPDLSGFLPLADCSGVEVTGEGAVPGDEKPLYQVGDAPAALFSSSDNRFSVNFREGTRSARGPEPAITDTPLLHLGRARTLLMQQHLDRITRYRVAAMCPSWLSGSTDTPWRFELGKFASASPTKFDWTPKVAEGLRQAPQTQRSASQSGIVNMHDSPHGEDFFVTDVLRDDDAIKFLGYFRGGRQTKRIGICDVSANSAQLRGCKTRIVVGPSGAFGGTTALLYIEQASAAGLVFWRQGDLVTMEIDGNIPNGSQKIPGQLVGFDAEAPLVFILGPLGRLHKYRIEYAYGKPKMLIREHTMLFPGFDEPKGPEYNPTGRYTPRGRVIKVESVSRDRVALIRDDGALAVIDTSSGFELWRAPPRRTPSNRISVASDYSRGLLALRINDDIRVWEIETGTVIWRTTGTADARWPGQGDSQQPWRVPLRESANNEGFWFYPADLRVTGGLMFEDSALYIRDANTTRKIEFHANHSTTDILCRAGIDSVESGAARFAPFPARTPDSLTPCAVKPTAKAFEIDPESVQAATNEGGNPSFDCDSELTDVEGTICQHELLSRLDRMLDVRYRTVRRALADDAKKREVEGALFADDQNTLITEQLQWLRARDACAAMPAAAKVRSCIAHRYIERLKDLHDWVNDQPKHQNSEQ